jgi:hypothetical protein
MFLEKSREVPPHFPSGHPQQRSLWFPNPTHSHPESHTNNLHFLKNLVKIGLPCQKLLNFGRKKSNFPTVRRFKMNEIVYVMKVEGKIRVVIFHIDRMVYFHFRLFLEFSD